MPPHRTTRPSISVLMPAYNADAFVRGSVESVLAQTLADLELIVVDDCSTDRTGEILRGIGDPRLRLYRNERNLGIVATLNRAHGLARGAYIARLDADDLSLPTRFEKQRRFLEQHPEVMIVGARMQRLVDGQIGPSRQPPGLDPAMVRWLYHIGNPLGHSSMMFRAGLVERLGAYLDAAYQYAEDFEFAHRVLQHGEIAMLPEELVVYRVHEQSLSQTRRQAVIDRATLVLSAVYARYLGSEAPIAARLISEHLVGGTTVTARETLGRLADLVDRLSSAYGAAHRLAPEQLERVRRSAGELWWKAVLAALRAGHLGPALGAGLGATWLQATRPPIGRLGLATLRGLVQGRPRARRARPAPAAAAAARGDPSFGAE